MDQILQLKLEYVRMHSWVLKNCYNKSTGENQWPSAGNNFGPSPFTYSTTRNKFTTIGCDIFGYIPSPDDSSESSYIIGCASFCNIEIFEKHSKINSCSGNNGCCQTSIPKGLKHLSFRTNSFNTAGRLWEIYPCRYGVMVENEYNDGFDRMLRKNQTLMIHTLPLWMMLMKNRRW